MFHLTHNIEPGAGAAAIAAKIEAAIAAGQLAPASQLPTVRELAAELGISPATVAAAYRTLRQRGLVSANTRRGTVVSAQPPLRVRGPRPLPADTRDLASGNPDPALLPPLAPALASLDPGHKLYGGPVKLGRLVELAQADFAADGIHGDIAIAGGALDGIERVLQTQLRPGDRVAVEDPCWPRIADLVRALGLQPEPARVDQGGLVPDELARALARAARSYAERRTALADRLADFGITAYGRSGLGVWIPRAEEVAAVQQLLERGWAVSPGERFRFLTPPGIRITATTVDRH